MSNVERSYNASRRMREGSIEMLNSYGLKRPLRFVAKWLPTDEFITESPVILGQENNVVAYRTLNRHRFSGRVY